jgi:hypothetical protein
MMLLVGMQALSAAAQGPPPAVLPAVAQPPGGYTVDIRRLSSPPAIDGKLDDAVWQEAAVLGDFVQDNPDTGQPATQKTAVRLGYDSRYLYVGIRCYDTEPGKIIAPVLERDGDLSNDDSVYVMLDTFHDGRNAFLFATNPQGAQVDGIVRNEGEEQNLEWDGLWQVATSRDAQGWAAEIAIPFKTLRFSTKEPQVWGFNVFRYLARRKEESAWRPILKEWARLSRYKISEYGEIHGLQDQVSGGRYSFLPYALTRHRDQEVSGRSTQGEAGGDLKISLTSQLVADLTVNTDFAEAEADQEQVNLTRFKLFFPEKRQFFLEGASLFYFGDRITVFDPPEPFVFFFSRQIGLTLNGAVEVPVIGGAKVSGKVGDVSVGMLNLETDRKAYVDDSGRRVEEPRTDYTVVRLKTDVYPHSTLGLIALDKDPTGPGYNQGLGMDWDLAFGSRLSSAGFVAQTQTPGLRGNDRAYSADLVYKGPVMRLGETYKDFEDNFNPEMGFLPRAGIRKSLTEGSWILVPDKGLMHQVSIITSLDHTTDQRGRLQTQIGFVDVGVLTRDRSGMAVVATDDVEVLDLPFEIFKGVVLPAGNYRFDHLFVGYASDYTRPLACTLWYDNGEFYDGRRLRTLVALVARPATGLNLSASWDRSNVHLKEGDFITDLVQSTMSYSFSSRLSTRLTMQWEKVDNLRANFLIDWIYRPDSHVFLVYNDIRDLDSLRRNSGFSPLDPGRSVTLKLSRRLDF